MSKRFFGLRKKTDLFMLAINLKLCFFFFSSNRIKAVICKQYNKYTNYFIISQIKSYTGHGQAESDQFEVKIQRICSFRALSLWKLAQF